MVDFEKAFDSVSWSFIQKALEFFNFGPDIRRWIKTFITMPVHVFRLIVIIQVGLI